MPQRPSALVDRVAGLLRDRRVFLALFGLHALIVITGVMLMWNTRSSDHLNYWEALAVLQGRY
jgi:hypothetical protein